MTMSWDGWRFVTHGESDRPTDANRVYIPAKVLHRLELFRCFATQLQLPGYFGWNWDALDECLRDLSWFAAKPILEIRHVDIPFRPGSHLRRSYLQLLRDLSEQTANTAVRICPVFPVERQAEIAAELVPCLTPPIVTDRLSRQELKPGP